MSLDAFRANLSAYSRQPRPDISDPAVRRNLLAKRNPYWALIGLNRHIGYDKKRSDEAYWVARWRTRNGAARQRRLAATDDLDAPDGVRVLDFAAALRAAETLFADPAISARAADAQPVRSEAALIYSPVGDVFTVAHALEELLEWKQLANAPSHVRILYNLANHHLLPRIGTLAASEVNAQTARRLVQEILETPPGVRPGQERISILGMDVETLRKRRRTANTVISLLREALRLAWDDGKVDTDRCWRVLRMTRLPYVPRALFLDPAETTRLIDAATPELRRLIFGALYTGCRINELLRMRVRDVARDGYGVLVLPGGKTRRGRFVFLCDEGLAYFLNLARDRGADEALFVRHGGALWTSAYRPAMRRAVQKAGIDPAFCFHSLRHTYASTLVRRGATFNTIADQLGHVNTVQVMRTYGHLAPQSRAAEVRELAPSLCPEHAAHARQASDALGALRARDITKPQITGSDR